MNLIQRIFGRTTLSKYFGFVVLLLIVAAIPLTLYVAKQSQDNRQRASGEQTSLYFAPDDGSTNPVPLTGPVTVTPGQTLSLRLYLNAGFGGQNISISGFDIILHYGNGLTLNSVTSGPGADRFGTMIFGPPDTIDNQNTTFRFTKVTTNANANISGVLHLATLRFTAGPTPLQSQITYNRTELTSLSSSNLLTVSSPTLLYIIANLPSPTATPVPTSTPAPTLPPLAADVDRNGCVGPTDFNLWAQAFQTGVVRANTFPDINIDGVVDLVDFNAWYNAMLSLPTNRICSQ